MIIDNTLKSLLGGAALSLALVAGGAQADTMTEEETATKLQEAIAANPELDEYGLDVQADEGKITVMGMIDDLEAQQMLQDIIDEMGLENVENEVVMQ